MGIPDGYTQATKEEIAKHFPVNQPNNMLINRSTNSYITFTITGAELQPSMVVLCGTVGTGDDDSYFPAQADQGERRYHACEIQTGQ